MRAAGCLLLLAGAVLAVRGRKEIEKRNCRQICALASFCRWMLEEMDRYDTPLDAMPALYPGERKKDCLGAGVWEPGLRGGKGGLCGFLESCEPASPKVEKWLSAFSRALEAPAGGCAPRETVRKFTDSLETLEASATLWQEKGHRVFEALCFGAAGAVIILLW